MSENRLRMFEHLLERVLLVAVILGIISYLTGCAYFEVDTKNAIDYRYTEGHTNMISKTTDDYPVYEYVFYPEKYEILWEYTYKDGHKERKWEECTRFEYMDAQKELGP
mgnify:CR=1 FL=1